MTFLDGDVVAPDIVQRLARGRPSTAVWRNEIGGTTWQLGAGTAREFVKVGPAHPEFDPAAEAVRLQWLAAFDPPVPRVLGHGDADGLRWFHTSGLPGRNAITVRDDDGATVRALGAGLRRFHDALPIDGCPFSWGVDDRLARLSSRSDLGSPPRLDTVVCHGDACNPNFLLDSVRTVSGYVDLGNLGVADRWADIAPAILSAGLNFGDAWGDLRWRDAFLAGYGTDLDEDKLDWYSRLWDAE